MPFRIKYILCLETMVPDFVNIWENAMKNNLKIISAIAFLGLAALACQALSSSPTSTAVPVDTDVPTNTDVPATAPQPTQQEAPTSESNNLFADDFSPGRNSWGTGTDADSSVEYVDDVLNIQVFTKNYFVWTTPNDKSYENIHAEVTVINNGADSTTAFGIICNQQYPIDESNYYFAVTLGGQYAIAKAALAQTDVFLTNMLLLMTRMIGSMPWCTAVAISWPVMSMPPSPTKAMTGRSGCTRRAATAAGTP
jgi:hypothetical protein